MSTSGKAEIGRRTLLKRGLLGGAVLLLGGGAGLYFVSTKEQAPPARDLHVLDWRAFQVVVAIARRVVVAPGCDAVEIAHGVDDLLTSAPIEAQRDTNKLLMLFENALPGLLFDGRALPFTRLSGDSQDATLRSWRDSSLVLRRTGYRVLRNLCLAAHWADESTWKAVGYEPPSGLNAAAYDDSKIGTPEWLAAQETGKAR